MKFHWEKNLNHFPIKGYMIFLPKLQYAIYVFIANEVTFGHVGGLEKFGLIFDGASHLQSLNGKGSVYIVLLRLPLGSIFFHILVVHVCTTQCGNFKKIT